MKLQYASDLHLEFPDNREFLGVNPLKPEGDILVLGGDIVPLRELDMYTDFFDYVSDNFALTYWLPGNHEYYRSDLNDRGITLNGKIRENIFLVNNMSVIKDGIRLVFSTLWTNVSPPHQFEIQAAYSDFHYIWYNGKLISVNDYNSLHNKCLAFLKEELKKETGGTTVVITHHMPVYPYGKSELIRPADSEVFAVDLRDLINDTCPDYWIYGHYHTNKVDFDIGSTRLRTNQLGYVTYNEQKGFDKGKNILI